MTKYRFNHNWHFMDGCNRSFMCEPTRKMYEPKAMLLQDIKGYRQTLQPVIGLMPQSKE